MSELEPCLASAKIRHYGNPHPALSQRERVGMRKHPFSLSQRERVGVKERVRGLALSPWKMLRLFTTGRGYGDEAFFLPLPLREGWGEGERTSICNLSQRESVLLGQCRKHGWIGPSELAN